jgi:hypothetical protein
MRINQINHWILVHDGTQHLVSFYCSSFFFLLINHRTKWEHASSAVSSRVWVVFEKQKHLMQSFLLDIMALVAHATNQPILHELRRTKCRQLTFIQNNPNLQDSLNSTWYWSAWPSASQTRRPCTKTPGAFKVHGDRAWISVSTT